MKLPKDHLVTIKGVLVTHGAGWDAGEYNGNEWHFHWNMHQQLVAMIDPDAYEVHRNGWKDYEATSPGEWNFTSKVISDRCKDLSRPKVDTSFSLSMHQDNTEQDTPLFRICRRVELRAYRSENMEGRGEDVSFERAVELLSLATLRLFNAHAQLKEVSRSFTILAKI